MIQTGTDPPSFDELNIYIGCKTITDRKRLLDDIHKRRVKCPVDGKDLRLGVRDRAAMIGDGELKTPSHRPPYLPTAPLLDIIRLSQQVKSSDSKQVRAIYDVFRNRFGPETLILTETPIEQIREENERIGIMIEAYRNKSIKYLAGGGGRYGTLIPPWESDNK